jgi:hypothetical protein
MIPAELAASTSPRPKPNRDDAMSCPGWKRRTLFAVSQPSVTNGIGPDRPLMDPTAKTMIPRGKVALLEPW